MERTWHLHIGFMSIKDGQKKVNIFTDLMSYEKKTKIDLVFSLINEDEKKPKRSLVLFRV